MADDDLSSFFDEVDKVAQAAPKEAVGNGGDSTVAGPAVGPSANPKKRKREDDGGADDSKKIVKVTKFVAPVKSVGVTVADASFAKSARAGMGSVAKAAAGGEGSAVNSAPTQTAASAPLPQAKDRTDWHSMTPEEREQARKALRRKSQKQYALEAAYGLGTEDPYYGKSSGVIKNGEVRLAAGKKWKDAKLKEVNERWGTDDYRVFLGNVAPDQSERFIMNKLGPLYSSLRGCNLVRDRDQKIKGYGFLSFGDGFEMMKCIKEWNGKLFGTRPIQMKRSTWKDRNVKVARKKAKKKEKLMKSFWE